MSKLLQAVNLSKHFIDGEQQKLTILESVNFDIDDRKDIAIVGASGSGKSTLLYLLAGLDQPSKGEVLFQGQSLKLMSEKESASWRNQFIGFVFQSHHLLPDFNLIENVALPALIAGKSRDSAFAEAEELLSLVNLSRRLSHKPAQLSGGEQQRAAIARALVNGPSLILADEPTGNLDSKNTEQVIELLKLASQEKGATLIVVTHSSQISSKMDLIMEIRQKHLLSCQ